MPMVLEYFEIVPGKSNSPTNDNLQPRQLNSFTLSNILLFKQILLVLVLSHKRQVTQTIHSFIHSQALIGQDRPLASLFGFLDHTHTDTR
jgi:hypothetical protein